MKLRGQDYVIAGLGGTADIMFGPLTAGDYVSKLLLSAGGFGVGVSFSVCLSNDKSFDTSDSSGSITYPQVSAIPTEFPIMLHIGSKRFFGVRIVSGSAASGFIWLGLAAKEGGGSSPPSSGIPTSSQGIKPLPGVPGLGGLTF